MKPLRVKPIAHPDDDRSRNCHVVQLRSGLTITRNEHHTNTTNFIIQRCWPIDDTLPDKPQHRPPLPEPGNRQRRTRRLEDIRHRALYAWP